MQLDVIKRIESIELIAKLKFLCHTYALEGITMAPYKHDVSTYQRSKRARKIKKASLVLMLIIAIGGLIVGIDTFLTDIRSENTVVSKESRATVESATINIFQTPYFRFQADDSWLEVTDDPNLSNLPEGSYQYLYRSYNKDFIDHEIWVTINLPEDYKIPRHNIPTRVLPVRIEKDGSITQIGDVSEHCFEALSDSDQNLKPHILTQNQITYYCHPNETNSYTVTLGIPSGTNVLPMPNSLEGSVDVTITYRNITQAKQSAVFERILRTFQAR